MFLLTHTDKILKFISTINFTSGTSFCASSQVADHDMQIRGVNGGRVGFLTVFSIFSKFFFSKFLSIFINILRIFGSPNCIQNIQKNWKMLSFTMVFWIFLKIFIYVSVFAKFGQVIKIFLKIPQFFSTLSETFWKSYIFPKFLRIKKFFFQIFPKISSTFP